MFKFSTVKGTVKSWFDSEAYDRKRERDQLNELIQEWRARSAPVVALELARLASVATVRHDRGEGLAAGQAMIYFAALYSLALPKLLHDEIGYWRNPGDELMPDPKDPSKKIHKDNSRFYVGDPVVKVEGNLKERNLKIHTGFHDSAAPYREVLTRIVPPHSQSAMTGQKHAVFYHIYDAQSWFAGFKKAAGEPQTARLLAEVLSKAARDFAFRYFSGYPVERDVMRDHGHEVDASWSRAQYYADHKAAYVVRVHPGEMAAVDVVHVTPGSVDEKLFDAALKDYRDLPVRAGREDRVAVNSR